MHKPLKFLTKPEIVAVLAELNRKARRSVNTRQNRTIFVLATFCGLRVSELTGLHLSDVDLNRPQPVLRIRDETTKGGCSGRMIPLWKLPTTLEYLRPWKDERQRMGADAAE